MGDYERPSRAAWKGRAGMQDWLARQETARERREQLRKEYREQLTADCAHGPRQRVIGQSGGQFWAGLECPAGNANCGVKFLEPAQVYQEWRDC